CAKDIQRASWSEYFFDFW
nr:immunoglobulin heavy chain junction region [Macaca mulatta]